MSNLRHRGAPRFFGTIAPDRPNCKFPTGNHISPHHQLQPPEQRLFNCEGCRYNVPAIRVPGSFAAVSSRIFKRRRGARSCFLSAKRVPWSAGRRERGSHQVPSRPAPPVSRRQSHVPEPAEHLERVPAQPRGERGSRRPGATPDPGSSSPHRRSPPPPTRSRGRRERCSVPGGAPAAGAAA